jgi:hypothetical protein
MLHARRRYRDELARREAEDEGRDDGTDDSWAQGCGGQYRRASSYPQTAINCG